MQKVLAAFFILGSIWLDASEETRSKYLQLIEQHPEVVKHPGSYMNGEIEIVLDPAQMEAIEVLTGRDVGVVAGDKYWLWINDACIFPNGTRGVYGRICHTKTLGFKAGVAVLPVMPDGRIALNCNFRHATRSWEIELPRGGIDPGESVIESAKREVLEETGLVIEDLKYLGEICPDSGVSSAVVPLFLGMVSESKAAQQEDSEAIEEILLLTKNEIKAAFLQGFFVHRLRGEEIKIPFRDPFLAYALMIYEMSRE